MGDNILNLGEMNPWITNPLLTFFKFWLNVLIFFLKFMFILSLVIFILWMVHYTLVIIAKKINECGEKSLASKNIADFIAVVNPIIIILPNALYRVIKKIQSFI